MGRKLYIEVDVEWEDHDDVCDELLFEDTEISSPYSGVSMKLLSIEELKQLKT